MTVKQLMLTNFTTAHSPPWVSPAPFFRGENEGEDGAQGDPAHPVPGAKAPQALCVPTTAVLGH